MNNYLSSVNALSFYAIVAVVLTFITVMCVVFLIKSYRAGIQIGIDSKVLKKTITASATFTLLPSISILLGVIALSGTLGVPFSWLRLSVIGALQYELNVAEIAAQNIGLSGLNLGELNMTAFVTIALVMTVGILGGVMCCIFFLKKYLNKIQAKPKKAAEAAETAADSGETAVDTVSTESTASASLEQAQGEPAKKPGFGAHATTAMFVGLCAAYIGAYIGQVFPGGGSNFMPLFVAIVAAISMAVFEFLVQKKKMLVLENFSLAASMLIAMASAVVLNMMI